MIFIHCLEDFGDEEEESKADFDQESAEMSEEGESVFEYKHTQVTAGGAAQ